MAQKIKLNRGPSHGQRMVIRDGEYQIQVMKPVPLVDIISAKEFKDISPVAKKGSYQKSNRRLKDGTWIFEWMGWYE